MVDSIRVAQSPLSTRGQAFVNGRKPSSSSSSVNSTPLINSLSGVSNSPCSVFQIAKKSTPDLIADEAKAVLFHEKFSYLEKSPVQGILVLLKAETTNDKHKKLLELISDKITKNKEIKSGDVNSFISIYNENIEAITHKLFDRAHERAQTLWTNHHKQKGVDITDKKVFTDDKLSCDTLIKNNIIPQGSSWTTITQKIKQYHDGFEAISKTLIDHATSDSLSEKIKEPPERGQDHSDIPSALFKEQHPVVPYSIHVGHIVTGNQSPSDHHLHEAIDKITKENARLHAKLDQMRDLHAGKSHEPSHDGTRDANQSEAEKAENHTNLDASVQLAATQSSPPSLKTVSLGVQTSQSMESSQSGSEQSVKVKSGSQNEVVSVQIPRPKPKLNLKPLSPHIPEPDYDDNDTATRDEDIPYEMLALLAEDAAAKAQEMHEQRKKKADDRNEKVLVQDPNADVQNQQSHGSGKSNQVGQGQGAQPESMPVNEEDLGQIPHTEVQNQQPHGSGDSNQVGQGQGAQPESMPVNEEDLGQIPHTEVQNQQPHGSGDSNQVGQGQGAQPASQPGNPSTKKRFEVTPPSTLQTSSRQFSNPTGKLHSVAGIHDQHRVNVEDVNI